MDAFCQVDYLRYPKVNRHAAKSIAIKFIHPVSLIEEFYGITNGHFGRLKHVGVESHGNPMSRCGCERLLHQSLGVLANGEAKFHTLESPLQGVEINLSVSLGQMCVTGFQPGALKVYW